MLSADPTAAWEEASWSLKASCGQATWWRWWWGEEEEEEEVGRLLTRREGTCTVTGIRLDRFALWFPLESRSKLLPISVYVFSWITLVGQFCGRKDIIHEATGLGSCFCVVFYPQITFFFVFYTFFLFPSVHICPFLLTGMGFVCFVVINSCVLSVNRVDLGFFFVSQIFQFYSPPPPEKRTNSHLASRKANEKRGLRGSDRPWRWRSVTKPWGRSGEWRELRRLLGLRGSECSERRTKRLANWQGLKRGGGGARLAVCRASLRFKKDRENIDSFRRFIDTCSLFSNRSEALAVFGGFTSFIAM